MSLFSCNDNDLIKIISEIKEIKAMKVTVNNCVSSGIIVGTATVLGGLLFGPRGIAIGGAMASATTALLNEGKFRSVPDILMNDLTVDQKRRLANAIRDLLSKENVFKMVELSVKLTSQAGFIELLKSVIQDFLKEVC